MLEKESKVGDEVAAHEERRLILRGHDLGLVGLKGLHARSEDEGVAALEVDHEHGEVSVAIGVRVTENELDHLEGS